MKKAQAEYRLAQIEYKRTQELKAKEYVPQADLDTYPMHTSLSRKSGLKYEQISCLKTPNS